MNEAVPFVIKSPLIIKSFPINVVEVGLPIWTKFGEVPAPVNILAVVILENDERVAVEGDTDALNFISLVTVKTSLD